METQENAAGSSRLLGESVPLLAREDGERPKKKPFYRARPLWIVPFALIAALVRGMTLAPRVEVFTQLSCHRIYGHHHEEFLPPAFTRNGLRTNLSSLDVTLGTPLYTPEAPPVVRFKAQGIFDDNDGDDGVDPNDDTSDPRNLPSSLCIRDPDVQAGAAQLQMVMTTTMGLLSALSTGWWGHFGERRGRTRVLAISTFGLFLTDLVFILVSNPSSVLSRHGHKLLLVAPIFEGALGGWSTLQATTSAYVSDCTSSGSRARIFSRFTGVTFLGIFFGPTISGYLIQHSSPAVGGTRNVSSVFWIAITCSFINFLLAMFVFPDSLTKEKREKAIAEYRSGNVHGKTPIRGAQSPGAVDAEAVALGKRGFFTSLFSPLAVFLPLRVRDPNRLNKYRRDWSLTLLAAAYFSVMLCAGLYQLKYLYAEHTYEWGAEQLSWYISFLGGMRALSLLLVLPYLIGVIKPRWHQAAAAIKGKGKAPADTEGGQRPKPTRLELGCEIGFDLMLTRCSFLVDMISNLLIVATPVPAFHHSSVMDRKGRGYTKGQSQALFVLASGLASLGTGAAPAIHSLALCILQTRQGEGDHGGGGAGSAETAQGGNVGGVFGAFAFLQATGSMILGPVLFGLVYSSTVAAVPKAIFMVASTILCVSLALLMGVRNPVREVAVGGGAGRSRKQRGSVERGRSRVRKDLRK